MPPPKKLMLNKKKSVWRTRITVALMILVALGTVCLILYYIFAHRTVSGSLNRARASMRSGDMHAAESAIRTAIAKDSASEESFRMLAKVLLAQGRNGEAAAALVTVSQLNPFDKTIIAQALALLEAGHYDADIILLLTENGFPKKDLTAPEQSMLAHAWIRLENTASAEELIKTLPDSREKTALTARLKLAQNTPAKEMTPLIESLIADPDYLEQGLFLKTRLCLLEGQNEEAKAAFNRLGQRSEASKTDEYLLLQAMLAVREERLNDAVGFYEELMKRQPGNADLRLDYAELLAAAPAISDRLERLNTLRAEFNGNARAAILAYYIDALTASSKGDFAAAAAAFGQTRLMVTRPAAIMLAMNCAIYNNDFSQMELLIPTVAALPENHVLRKNVTANLETATARLMQAGDTANMTRAARVLITVSPNHAMALRAVLRDALATAKWDEARIHAESLLRTYPNDPEALESRMVALYRQGRPSESLAAAEDILKKAPSFLPALLYKARILTTQQRRPAEAKDAWMALMAQPEALVPEYANESVIALIRLNQTAALETLCALLEKQEAPELKVVALLSRAQAALARKDLKEAENTFRKAIALMPESQDLYLMLAQNLADPGARIAVLREGLSRLPGNAPLTLTLCTLLLSSNDAASVESCLALLDAAKEKNADLPGLALMRSDVLAALKRTDEALTVAEALFKTMPQVPAVNAVTGMRRVQSGHSADALPLLRVAYHHRPELAIAGLKEAYLTALRTVAREGKSGADTLWAEVLSLAPGDAEAAAALNPGGQP